MVKEYHRGDESQALASETNIEKGTVKRERRKQRAGDHAGCPEQ
jgi:hypothetical protein